MKTTTFTATLALAALSITASAMPTDKPASKDGVDYSKVDYSNVDWSKVKYPADAGANLPSYPAPKGGWENVKYPPGTGAGATVACKDGPFDFTSTYHVVATPDQVVNGSNAFTGGLKGAYATYDFGINSDLDYICFDIKLVGFEGEYQSPARTATHVHEAAKGKSGPPRLSLPNPVAGADPNVRYSRGCLSAPYTTGVVVNGTDTGAGFSVKKIEANPAGFFADVHSSLAVPGAVRGQIA